MLLAHKLLAEAIAVVKMVNQYYYVSCIQKAIGVLDSSEAGKLQQQAKQLFKQQLHAGLVTRLQLSFKQKDVDTILQSLDDTLSDRGLLSQFSHTIHCGGVYAARAALDSCLAAVQGEVSAACRTEECKVRASSLHCMSSLLHLSPATLNLQLNFARTYIISCDLLCCR